MKSAISRHLARIAKQRVSAWRPLIIDVMREAHYIYVVKPRLRGGRCLGMEGACLHEDAEKLYLIGEIGFYEI